MFSSWFGKKDKSKENAAATVPQIMGLGIDSSFELDTLSLRIHQDKLSTTKIAGTQIVTAVGLVELDGNQIYRFYTDDEAFLQVVASGPNESDVIDVKLFHYFDTLDINNQQQWDELLKNKIGTEHFELNGKNYKRVWTSASAYHNPVHMEETTYDEASGLSFSTTDQFTMLFELELADDFYEFLFISAEEQVRGDNLERCLVYSTGINISSSQITIYG